MRLGYLTVLFGDRPLSDALDVAAELGLDAVELGTGNYPGDVHCSPATLLEDPDALRRLRDDVAARGLRISALSQHGNPLHPDPSAAAAAHRTWEQTLELANRLEVDVVNAFSGCPGDGTSTFPNWVTCAWPDEFQELLAWQWEERVVPYWQVQAAAAERHGVSIAFEMHPGMVVYNPETLLRLRAACGPRVCANFDPSHLWWQGIEPVAAIRELAAEGAIAHVHAKDVAVDAGNLRRNGVLDTKPYTDVAGRSWSFRTVGWGHGEDEWRALISALAVGGYDGVLSIEHEDPLMSAREGLGKAVALLKDMIVRENAGRPWWT
jgi:sugar phosphate isomerase/epimerase